MSDNMKTNLVLILKNLLCVYFLRIRNIESNVLTPSEPFLTPLDQLQSEIQQFSKANEQLRCDVEALHKSSTAEEQSYLTSVHHLQEQIQQLQTIVPLFLPPFLTRSATIATANAKKSKKRPDGSKNSKPVPRKASSFDVVCTTRSKNSAETSASSRVCVRPSSPTASTAVLPRCGWRATRRCA